MTLASITVEKVMERGEQKFKIISFSNIKKYDELPIEYINGAPRFSRGSEETSISTDSKTYVIGTVISRSSFDGLIKTMKEAGTRLTEINKRIKEQQKTWNGTITITI